MHILDIISYLVFFYLFIATISILRSLRYNLGV